MKKNIKNEVVWVFKDNSFINLTYLLSDQNSNNDTLESFNDNNNTINTRNSKYVIISSKSYNKNVEEDNNIIKKDESNNLDNKQGRITKKIIKRKNDSIYKIFITLKKKIILFLKICKKKKYIRKF